MLKILHIYKTANPYSIGGVESVIDAICRYLSDKSIISDVLVINDINEKKTNGYNVYGVKGILRNTSSPIPLDSIFRIKSIIKKYDVINFHYPWPSGDLLIFLCGLDQRIIVTYHSDIVRQKLTRILYMPLEKFFLKKVNSIVATSPNYIESSNNLKNYKNKTFCIPIGIDDYCNLGNSVNEKLVEGKYFLFLGVIRYYKGLQYLLEAAKFVRANIVIAGDGPFLNRLKKTVISRGIKNVIFLGRVSEGEKNNLLSNCYSFVFPSHLRSEAFGVSLLEAAKFGRPLISCEIGTGTTFVNINNVTGLTVEPRCSYSLANAMNFLLDNNIRAKEMGANARKRFEEYFTTEKMCSKYLNLYLGKEVVDV